MDRDKLSLLLNLTSQVPPSRNPTRTSRRLILTRHQLTSKHDPRVEDSLDTVQFKARVRAKLKPSLSPCHAPPAAPPPPAAVAAVNRVALSATSTQIQAWAARNLAVENLTLLALLALSLLLLRTRTWTRQRRPRMPQLLRNTSTLLAHLPTNLTTSACHYSRPLLLRPCPTLNPRSAHLASLTSISTSTSTNTSISTSTNISTSRPSMPLLRLIIR